jgi:SAM-dependent methyltransferase
MRSFGNVILRWVQDLLMAGEAWWFDTSRHVETSGTATLKELTTLGDASDSCSYLPVRPRRARQALRALPVQDHSSYIFVDIGSGKGRMLMVAAEYPYRKIVGIEFAVELNDQAVKNIAAYRSTKRMCREIESLCMNALDFPLPDENLVLYFFNPFGSVTMQLFLQRLDCSLERSPRDVLVITYFREFEALFAGTRHLRLYRIARRCHIYRSTNTAEACPPPLESC